MSDIYGWGKNGHGELLGADGEQKYAMPLDDYGDFVDIQLGKDFVTVLRSDGTVWAVGNGSDGNLGQGDYIDSTELVDVGLTGVTKIIATTNTVVLKDDGTVWTWGSPAQGVDQYLGIGAYDMIPSPVPNTPHQVVKMPPGGLGGGEDMSPSAFPPLDNIVDLWAGYMSFWALRGDGLLFTWGQYNHIAFREDDLNPGEYELPNIGFDKYPGMVPFTLKPDDWHFGFVASEVSDIQFGKAFGVILKTDSTLVSFGTAEGINNANALGRTDWLGSSDEGISADEGMYLPAAMDISGVEAIACGMDHGVALKSDGTVWCWGRNDSGQLGTGSWDDEEVPAQVVNKDETGFLEDIVSIAAGDYHTVALATDGTVWTWGNGDNGELGDGTKEDSNKPVEIGIEGPVLVEEFNACEDELPAIPDPEPDPEPGWPIPGDPEMPAPVTPVIPTPGGTVGIAPGGPPYVEIPLPPNTPIPPPGTPINYTPPGATMPIPATVDNIQVPEPGLDPCNTGMPAPMGGICAPGGGSAPGGNVGGMPPGGAMPPGGGKPPGGGPIVGGPGSGGVPPGGTPPGGGTTSKYFTAEKCYKNTLVTTILNQLAGMLNIAPPQIPGAPCTEKYTGCFAKGSSIFDAMRKMAALCTGEIIIPPIEPPIIIPPSPTNVHHYLHEDYNIFFLERVYDAQDLFHHVEAFRPALYRNGVEVLPGVSKISLISSPFNPSPTSIKLHPVYDYNLTEAQIQNIANLEAGKLSGQGARMRVTTLQSNTYALYDHLHMIRPSIDWYTDWMIRSIEHSYSAEGHLSIIEATWIGVDADYDMTEEEVLGIPGAYVPPGDPALPGDPVQTEELFNVVTESGDTIYLEQEGLAPDWNNVTTEEGEYITTDEGNTVID